MGKNMMVELQRRIKSYRPRKTTKRDYLGFANDYEEQLFRALVAAHPKAVRIDDAGWRLYADQHVKLGLFSCAIKDAAHYRLTREGVRRAAAERLMREPAN
jgi:hypothetical protein